MKKYVVSSANWKKKIQIDQLENPEETVFEASTRGVEWALENGKEVGIFTHVKHPDFDDRDFVCLSHKVLSNAGYFSLAEIQRQKVKEEFNIDLAKETLDKVAIKLRKASLKKSFCITKLTEVNIDGRKSKVPIVCINLGLFEEEEEAKEKCKELNESFKSKIFFVKKMLYNFSS